MKRVGPNEVVSAYPKRLKFTTGAVVIEAITLVISGESPCEAPFGREIGGHARPR